MGSNEEGVTHESNASVDSFPHDGDYDPTFDDALDLPEDTVIDSESSVGGFDDVSDDDDVDMEGVVEKVVPAATPVVSKKAATSLVRILTSSFTT